MAYVVKNQTQAVHSIQINGKIIVLKPGNNEVDEKDWEKLKENRKVDERITSGKYVMIAPDVTGKEDQKKQEENGASENLSGYSVNKVKSLLTDIFDVELLNRWETEESRPKVVAAIKARIKFLESK